MLIEKRLKLRFLDKNVVFSENGNPFMIMNENRIIYKAIE